MMEIDIPALVLRNLEPDKMMWMKRANDALQETGATADDIRNFVNMLVQSSLCESVSLSQSKEVSAITRKTRTLVDAIFASPEAIRHDFATIAIFTERARIAAKNPPSSTAGDLFRQYVEEQDAPADAPTMLQSQEAEPEPWESDAPHFSSLQKQKIHALCKHSISEWTAAARDILGNFQYDVSDKILVISFIFHVVECYIVEQGQNGMATEPAEVTAALIREQMDETVRDANQWELTRLFEEFLAKK